MLLIKASHNLSSYQATAIMVLEVYQEDNLLATRPLGTKLDQTVYGLGLIVLSKDKKTGTNTLQRLMKIMLHYKGSGTLSIPKCP